MNTENKLTGYPSIDKPWLKYYSDEAINAPLPECTIYEYMWNNNKDHLDNIALNYFDRKITYKELFDNIEKAAKAFTAMGVKEGDIVVTATVTTPETVYILYALNRIGAIPNMVDPRTAVEGIREYIKEVNAEYVITLEVAYPKIAKAIEGTSVKKILVTSPADSLPPVKKFFYKMANHSEKLSDICVRWEDFIKNGNNSDVNYAPYKKDTCCVIVHTGGTTGSPKGAMLSNDNLNAATYQCILSGIDMAREHTWLNIMPAFIAYGVGNGLHLPLVIGMETILIPQFNPEKFADLLIKYKPNHMVGAPTHYDHIIHNNKMKDVDLSYIIAPTVGGDTMKNDLEKDVNAFLSTRNCNYQITKGYGMTEVCAAVSVCISNECNKIGSTGVPFSHTLISIFDIETGKELPYGTSGEICISGPNTMIGYYNNESATNELIKKHEDGLMWVHSGDIGYMTEDGFLFVEGRIKRLIIRYDGFKVFPTLIENTVSEHKAVKSCSAVGKADKTHSQGKLPILFIVLNPDYIGKEEMVKSELIVLCKNELPEYAQPVDFRFCDSLPLTPIGKIDYRTLEEMAEEQNIGG